MSKSKFNYEKEKLDEYEKILKGIFKEFEDRFVDLRKFKLSLKVFLNPFEIDLIHEDLTISHIIMPQFESGELELIELQEDMYLKSQFKTLLVIEFWGWFRLKNILSLKMQPIEYFLFLELSIILNDENGTFCLFGRELLISGEPDLSTAHLEKSRIRKLVINMREAYVPFLLICEEYGETKNNADDAIKEIKKKIKLNEFQENSLEVLKYKNIFHEDLNENITAIKIMKNISFKTKTNFMKIKKKIRQFNSYDEFFLISKKIKGPCLLKIDYTEDFILYNQFKSVKLDPSNTITVLGKVDLPKINYASLTIKYHNNSVEGYSLCINGNKFICGMKDNSVELKTIKNGNNIFKTYSQEQKIIKDIQYFLDSEQIDSLVVYNLPHAILNKFDFVRFLFCDLYAYSLGNLKCRDYSLEDLRDYYNCKANSYSFSFYFGDKFGKLSTESKLIFDIYIASDALLLAKEMAEISGCSMNKVLSNNRAKIIDFALLNELYDRNYIFPSCERKSTQQYTGGMVLTPAIGAYTDAVLLLDFNSLYPSIVQEFNVCFSTIGNSNAEIQNITEDVMPILEKSSVSLEKGFLPIVISNLVNRRREVKKLITKNFNGNNKIYDLRQKALKLLANSIYGCLGFPISRFCNYTMASFITRKGRNLLEEARNIAINELGLDVIYGDTDSIMINTKFNYCDENLDNIKKISEEFKNRVNSKYKHIEIDLEKIFVRLFLYKKKKYAGLYAAENGSFKKEYKGIDTVRRDVCKATIDILNGVLDILLDDSKPLDFEESKKQIFALLYKEAAKIKTRPVTDFIINMTLSKPLELYDKNAPLPHVCLAKRLTEKGIYIDQRDMISFVIGCTENNEPVYKRAFLPSEVQKIDYEYYVTNQILSSLLKIVRIPNCIDINDLQRIFGVKTSVVNTQSISTHFVKFITTCCNKLQDPNDQCVSCNKDVSEEFYFKKVKQLVNNEITNLYKSSPKKCDVLLYCVDLTWKDETWLKAKEELRSLLYRNIWMKKNLLILGTKNDLEDALECKDMILKLDLLSITDREIACYSVSAKEEITHFKREQFEPFKSFYIEPKIENERLALNHYLYTFKPSKMIVNYIKRELNHEQIGLKRFREFNFVELKKNTMVKHEVYEVLPPFVLEEYYDGSFLYLKFTNLEIEITVFIDGFIEKLTDTVFKCHFNTKNIDVIIRGIDFIINHKPLCMLEKEMNNVHISTFSDYFLISVNLDKTRCFKFDESVIGTQSNKKQLSSSKDIENELKNITISDNESTNSDLQNLKYYTMKNDKLEFNEDVIGPDNYLLTQDMLFIRLFYDNLNDIALNLKIGQITIEFDKGNLLLNKQRIELLKAKDMYIIQKWPSQTIDFFGPNNIIVGTNPDEGDSKIISFDLNKSKEESNHSENIIPQPLNRIRYKDFIYGVSDDSFYIFNTDLEIKHNERLENGVGYGLCTADDFAYFTSLDGEVCKMNEKGLDKFKLHKNSIESLSYFNNLLFSASTDKTVKVTDLRSMDTVYSKLHSCDINAIDFNKENHFVYGDDNGILRVVDLRMNSEQAKIEWHKTSISSVKWKDTDVFASSSDQQVCLFDLTLEEDWSYEKYLLFVHQGQKFYKEVCFTPSDYVITTSIDGLCLFKPISFEK
ncbi:hypothetical protein evm_013402 [Chilo suppressalis]|nr:hypothetical protein evm_013402 [Chilo suppressalis]